MQAPPSRSVTTSACPQQDPMTGPGRHIFEAATARSAYDVVVRLGRGHDGPPRGQDALHARQDAPQDQRAPYGRLRAVRELRGVL